MSSREQLSKAQCEAAEDKYWVEDHIRENDGDKTSVQGHCRSRPE